MKKFDSRNQVVIMCGISGSGKTHYARQLEQEGYIRLSTDNLIWEKTGEGLYKLSKEEQKELFFQCNQEVRRRLKHLLLSGRKVVMDSTNCKRTVRDEIRRICAELELEPVFVYCSAQEEELWQRLSRRKGTGPDDLIVTRTELSEYWRGFERPQEDETDFIFFVQ